MPPLQLAAISFALSQLVLSVLLLAGLRCWGVQQRIYALLLLAITCYLLDPLLSGQFIDFALTALTVAVPGMFWLFSTSLFDDHFRLKPWHIALVAATVVPPLIGQLLHLAGIDAVAWLLFTLPQILEFVLLTLTLYVVVRHWKTDLIESRRRLRLWFSGLNGFYIFMLLLFREVLFVGEQWLNTLQFVPVGGILLATNAILLVYRQEIWSSNPPKTVPVQLPVQQSVLPTEQPIVTTAAQSDANKPSAPAAENDDAEIDPQLMAELETLMQVDKVYREMGLTIGKLAAQLSIPEYRLRQLINAGLGYRNFNDFLNQFRTREASERLADPAQREKQVLVIALDAGFRSLSSFNKAFKSTYDVTPTAYRKQQLND